MDVCRLPLLSHFNELNVISDRNFYQQNVSNMYMNLLERNFSTGEEKNVFLGMQSYLPSAEVNCVSLIVFSGVSVLVDSFRHCVMLRSFSVCFSLSAYLVLRKFCFCTWCSAIIIYDNDIYEMSIKISICYLGFFYCRILRVAC